MASDLLTSAVWRDITRAAKRHPNSCKAAIAYFGTGASKLLPLRAGSVLIVDMSKAALGSGQTNPRDVLRLLTNGVEVHSVGNLHAKVLAFPRRAFVGSANASHSSADGLIEAVIRSGDSALISAARAFVDSLKGERIGPERAKAMLKDYKPPRFGKSKMRHRRPVAPQHPTLWVIPLITESWEDRDYQEADRGRPEARRRMRSSRKFELDEFCWDGAAFTDKARRGHTVLQVVREANGTFVSQPGSITHVRSYRIHGHLRAIVYVEIPRGKRRLNLKRALRGLGPAASELRRLRNYPRAVRNLAKVHAILNYFA